MGCTTSSTINDLPVVSLCHERCKLLEEALYQTHALANATVAYMESLQSVGCCLHQLYFRFHHNDININSHSSNSDFQEDREEDATREDREVDYLNPIHVNHFNNVYYGQTSNNTGFTWKTPSPPPAPTNSTWDFLNVFETFQIIDREVREEATYERTGGDNVMKVEEVAVTVPSVLFSPSNDQKMERMMKELFKKAADSGHEALRILDFGKFRFHHYNYSFHNRTLSCGNGESFSPIQKIGSIPGEEPDKQGPVDLASTLKKLCAWEDKLYSEVKAEEKLRLIYTRKRRHMRCLVEKGANPNEQNSINILLGVLSANVKVSIQVIERISAMINRLRDVELWPLMTQFFHKLIAMWKSIEECHKSMSLAFAELKLVNAISSSDCGDDTDTELWIQLDTELQNWNPRFSNWVSTQRGFVKALNDWFTKCLCLSSDSEQLRAEVVPPFSPNGMSEMPTMFVFCTKWSLAAERVSEMEVIDAMHRYSITINHLLEQKYFYLQQKPSAEKGEDKGMQMLDKELERMQRLVGCKKKLLCGRNAIGSLLLDQKINPEEMSKNFNTRLLEDLKRILVTLERFSASITQDYNEIYLGFGLEI